MTSRKELERCPISSIVVSKTKQEDTTEKNKDMRKEEEERGREQEDEEKKEEEWKGLAKSVKDRLEEKRSKETDATAKGAK